MMDPNQLVYPHAQQRTAGLNVLRSLIPTTDVLAEDTTAGNDDDFPACTTDM